MNWWAVLAHLRKLTGAQVKPETVQRYIEELTKAQSVLDRSIQREQRQRVKARQVQGLPHTPKLEPSVIAKLVVTINSPEEEGGSAKVRAARQI
jgi:hypothetical protein